MKVLFFVAAFWTGSTIAKMPRQESIQRAKDFLDENPVFDGHNDLPWTFRNNVDNDLSKVDLKDDLTQIEPWKSDNTSHTDIPRMEEGRLKAQFWSAYIGCGAQYKDAVQLFMEQVDVIKRMTQDYPDDMAFCLTADETEAAMAEGKVASLIGIEGGHAINSNLGILRLLHEMGARYMTLTHNCNTPWADASQVEAGTIDARSNGLSDFGERVIYEMNRLGIFVDLSHVTSDVMKDVLSVTLAPVIFSHSNARAVCSHNRNVPDDVLTMLKNSDVGGGVVMVNLYSAFLNDDENAATIDDAVAHLNHIRDVCGIECVGMGADYNGVDLLPEGLEDVSTYPNLFAALMEDGWTDEELALLANGNIMRAFRQMEQVRDDLAGQRWAEDQLSSSAWFEEETHCMSEVEGTKQASEEDDSGAAVKNVSFVVLVGLIATLLAMK